MFLFLVFFVNHFRQQEKNEILALDNARRNTPIGEYSLSAKLRYKIYTNRNRPELKYYFDQLRDVFDGWSRTEQPVSGADLQVGDNTNVYVTYRGLFDERVIELARGRYSAQKIRSAIQRLCDVELRVGLFDDPKKEPHGYFELKVVEIDICKNSEKMKFEYDYHSQRLTAEFENLPIPLAAFFGEGVVGDPIISIIDMNGRTLKIEFVNRQMPMFIPYLDLYHNRGIGARLRAASEIDDNYWVNFNFPCNNVIRKETIPCGKDSNWRAFLDVMSSPKTYLVNVQEDGDKW